METLREFTYLGDSASARGRCMVAMTVRTGCRWPKFGECGDLLHQKRFPLKLKRTVYISYVRPAILYVGDTC